MKRTLSVLLFASASLMFGQTIVSENFNSLTAGNLATDVTGATPGQGGYSIYGGAASDYQVVAIDAAHVNSLRITSGAGYSSTANTFNRFAFKGITTTASAGNDILQGTVDIYTGPATGAGRIQCALYDATAGIVGIGYDYSTKKIVGMGRLTPVSTGTAAFYTITLGTTSTYTANTWVTVSFRYNKTTGAYTWTTPEGSFTFNNSSYTFTPGLVPLEYDFISVTSTGNTVANQAAVDNLNLIYTNSATLATNEVTNAKNSVSVYPNPVTDYVNIKSDDKINKVEIFDLSGRKVFVTDKNEQINVTDLAPGNYIMNIDTINGNVSKKLIKK
ncbi:T9SS type A sorting domain-containing protein [uncultured Chryseobacterium sp.]|uniref:T9SS type A sorting domain-containing protein n=1 Tax=uncultured Chryseobacterium sp. TaxID=259322 RepID=UPI0025D5AAA6|nr:T9SS type A sorting domain-containing protein [uncultured Chryseobacterium sp.]